MRPILFVRACQVQNARATPVGLCARPDATCRDRAVRRPKILCQICKSPNSSCKGSGGGAEVTLPRWNFLEGGTPPYLPTSPSLEVMGFAVPFLAGEARYEKPIRSRGHCSNSHRPAAESGYVRMRRRGGEHFAGKRSRHRFLRSAFQTRQLHVTGRLGHYLHAKKMMYNSPAEGDE